MSTFKMLKTCKQSYEMYFPNSTNKFIGYGLAPPLPVEPDAEYCKLSQRIDTGTIYWTHEKTEIYYDDGNVVVYWVKPSLQNAFDKTKLTGGGNEYYRFHSNGSVEHGINGDYYHWGPDTEIEFDCSDVHEICNECFVSYDSDYDSVDYDYESPMTYDSNLGYYTYD